MLLGKQSHNLVPSPHISITPPKQQDSCASELNSPGGYSVASEATKMVWPHSYYQTFAVSKQGWPYPNAVWSQKSSGRLLVEPCQNQASSQSLLPEGAADQVPVPVSLDCFSTSFAALQLLFTLKFVWMKFLKPSVKFVL